MPITMQSGIREYNGDLSKYTGMRGGLTPDIHTLRSLNPLTTNRTIAVMYRGPYFLMHYFGEGKDAYGNQYFKTYKKLIEYYSTAISVNLNDQSLGTQPLQGGFSGRSIAFATTQNAQSSQTLSITVPELVGRPVATFHNMWIDGIADQMTGLTTYHGLVAGSVNEAGVAQRIYAPNANQSDMALEPSPAWEVAEFLIIALDRSGSRVDGAVMALGCYPQKKVGNEIFGLTANGQSNLSSIQLDFTCQYVQSAYVNDIATRYVKQFAITGNSLNFNPGCGDAFFTSASASEIDTQMFDGGKRPTLDSIQTGLGNAPVFSAQQQYVQRDAVAEKTISLADHSRIYNSADTTTDISNPYQTEGGFS